MRGTVPGLLSPHPLGDGLPAVYLADPFAQQLCGGLDEVLAPILACLDSFPAYLDPLTAPDDMLGWLAGWLGLEIDDNLPEPHRRRLVSGGVQLLSRFGTVSGLRDAIAAYLGIEVEILDPGGSHWSVDPGSPLPGSANREVVVRLRAEDQPATDLRRLESVIASAIPAGLRYRVEIAGTA